MSSTIVEQFVGSTGSSQEASAAPRRWKLWLNVGSSTLTVYMPAGKGCASSRSRPFGSSSVMFDWSSTAAVSTGNPDSLGAPIEIGAAPTSAQTAAAIVTAAM
jgi:hypothetical protein